KMSISLDKEAFFRRLQKLYSTWEAATDAPLEKCDAVVVSMGTDEDVVYSKTTALQTWLCGYELTDTVMVFCKQTITVLSSKKKIQFLKDAVSGRTEENANGLPNVELMLRDKENNEENFVKLIQTIKESKNGNVIGQFHKDKFSTKFIDSWKEALGKAEFESVDISAPLAVLMAPKDESEIAMMKRAAGVTLEIYSKVFKENVKDVIDADRKVKHSKMSELIEKALEDKTHLKGTDPTLVETCYPPIIQSGGTYNLKFSVVSDKNTLHFGCIICMFGVRYRSYCSNVVRTLMVNPSDEMQSNYTFLVELEELMFEKLKPGVRLCDVYSSVLSKVRSAKPQLVSKLTRSFGFAMGIEFREGALLINGKNQVKAEKGMVFNINIGFENLVNPDGEKSADKNYALYVGDMVLVNDEPPASLITRDKKKARNISIFLKDESEEESEEEEDSANVLLGRGARSALVKEKTRQEISAEVKRQNHQRELRMDLNKLAKERIMHNSGSVESSKVKKSNVSYKSRSLLPVKEPDIYDLKIFIDKKYETIVLPLFGIPTPFHISTIKNISMSTEGDYSYLRINFFCPGSTIVKENTRFPSTDDAMFIKELTYRALANRVPGRSEPPAANLQLSFRLIKELQKKFKTREDEEREKEIKFKFLTLNFSFNNLTLKKGNCKYIQAFINGEYLYKFTNIIDATHEGFRYTSVRGDKVDILYNNIRHAIFQPCDHEMIIVLHFHLKNAMMFGKKRQIDVQFYTEVGEMTTDLGKMQHMRDRDDLYAEQAERELRHKLNTMFKNFVDKAETISRGEIEFDSPFRELSYFGVPFRSTCLLQPTSAALINIVEWPPFIATLDEIELVHFERVQFHLKSCDMVIVFKDYKKKVETINSIPMQSLEAIREWLNSCDIHYTEGIQSLNWGKILKTILDDPEAFFEQGGWSFLEPQSDGEGDDSDESESDFNPQSSEGGSDEEGSEDSDEDYSSDDEGESDAYEGSLGSDEESGKDWDELEEEARFPADENKNNHEEQQPEPRKRKRDHSSHRKSAK
uniref:FACT complex subunit n=1 Tax=Ciona intestinalis TaxID=7719 RepID=F6QIX3_CIOIN